MNKLITFFLVVSFPILGNITLNLTQRQICDLELIINGGFHPLRGFLCRQDYESVLSSMRLSDGTLWPIPIILDIDESLVQKINMYDHIDLKWNGEKIATLLVQDMWVPDKILEAQSVYGTTDEAHYGVNYLGSRLAEKA